MKNRFRPQQGLTIMNHEPVAIFWHGVRLFPSPTRVTYYESFKVVKVGKNNGSFPSPTGVTNYELKIFQRNLADESFRPQQRLLIMNHERYF